MTVRSEPAELQLHERSDFLAEVRTIYHTRNILNLLSACT